MKKQRHHSSKPSTISAPHEQEPEKLNHQHDVVSPTVVRQALHKPNHTSHSTILSLQQTYGNRAVQRLIQQKSTAATVQRGLFKNLFKVKTESEEKIAPGNVKDVLNSDIFPYFEKYCKRTQNMDGLEFIEVYQIYKSSPDISKAKDIYDEFIDPNGKNSLNLQGGKAGNKSRKQIAKEIADYMHPVKFKKDGGEMYDLAYELVLTDLAVPYMEFQPNSEEYKAWLEE